MEPTVKRYSHHFIISDVDSTYQRGIDAFARRLVQTESNMDRFGNIITSKVHTFAVRHGFEMAYRFHINHLEQLTEFLASGGLRFDAGPMVDLYVPSVANFQVKDGWVPRDDQVAVVDYLSSPGLKKVVDAQTGSGKGLVHGTPVRTINGWANVENLTTNDKVMGETGEYHNVTGVFPQGNDLDLYEVMFDDGRTIVTDAVHLWQVTSVGEVKTVSTRTLFEQYQVEFKDKPILTIPLVSNTAVQADSELPIDPYVLGTLLHKKEYIPEEYLYASQKQRYDLAAGILDTGGELRYGYINYQTMSWCLKDGIVELFYSLGCHVSVTEMSVGYNLRIVVKDPQRFFRDKANKVKAGELLKTLPDLELLILSVRKLPYKDSTTCISVDNPTKLFVTKDYIVTHNTIMTMFALAKVKVRCALVVKPMYISRWMDVLVGKDMVFKNFGSKDVMTVRGSAQMASIINLAREGEFNVDFVVISNRTYINYLQHYDENGPSEEYGWCRPEELWNLLGVGIRLIDEAHQDFYGCFLTDLHSHVPTSIELSGSLEPDMDFLKAMYAVMYPKALRMNTGVYKRYVDIIGLLYSLDTELPHPRTTRRGRASYSQAAYEEAIIKVPMRTRRLQEMMSFICNNYFMSERLPDHKLLVFFDTVGMCAIMADYYQELYPDLYVSKYTEEEDPSVLDEADIIIATPASAGTAVDITNLQQVHSFVMRSSTQALIQMLGRLRKLSTDTISPKYLYICTNDIITHQKYQYKMQEVFRFRAKNQEQRALPHVI